MLLNLIFKQTKIKFEYLNWWLCSIFLYAYCIVLKIFFPSEFQNLIVIGGSGRLLSNSLNEERFLLSSLVNSNLINYNVLDMHLFINTWIWSIQSCRIAEVDGGVLWGKLNLLMKGKWVVHWSLDPFNTTFSLISCVSALTLRSEACWVVDEPSRPFTRRQKFKFWVFLHFNCRLSKKSRIRPD